MIDFYMEILDNYKNILFVGDWVKYHNYQCLILDMNNSLFKNKQYPGVLAGAIAIAGPGPNFGKLSNVFYEKWYNYPNLKSQFDKCFILQHSLFWVWPIDVSKIHWKCLLHSKPECNCYIVTDLK